MVSLVSGRGRGRGEYRNAVSVVSGSGSVTGWGRGGIQKCDFLCFGLGLGLGLGQGVSVVVFYGDGVVNAALLRSSGLLRLELSVPCFGL